MLAILWFTSHQPSSTDADTDDGNEFHLTVIGNANRGFMCHDGVYTAIQHTHTHTHAFGTNASASFTVSFCVVDVISSPEVLMMVRYA